LATVEALLTSGAQVTAWDDKAEARDQLAPRGGLDLADLAGADLSPFDSIVVTPGLPLNRHPIAQRARDASVEVIGDIELFARTRPELPPHKVAGITGTNGKSTTTALVHHILHTAGVPSLMGGNIGLPILSQDPLPEGGVYVLELSSYQIDLTHSLDCDVAVLLNVTPDHLDRYADFFAYRDAKLRLFEMQSGSHTAVWNLYGDETEFVRQTRPDSLSWFTGDDHYNDQENWPSLQGPHNLENADAGAVACKMLGFSDDDIKAGLRTYPGLPHRMERARERNGVLYVNDSKATNATSTAPALAAYPAVHWILGGRAKSDELDACAPYFDHVRAAYTIGEAGPMFAKVLRGVIPVIECGTLDVSVKQAAAAAQPGETVLLSPACASFDQFKDFEARGDAFKTYVGALA